MELLETWTRSDASGGWLCRDDGAGGWAGSAEELDGRTPGAGIKNGKQCQKPVMAAHIT